MAQRPGRTPLVPGDGRARHLPRARGALGRMALVAAGGPGAQPLAHARDRAGHAAGLHRGRGRVDGHRAGPAAVGDLRGSEDPRRGHPDAGAGRAVRHLHAAVLLPGSDRRVAPVPAHRPQSGGTGMARVLHVGRRVVTLADWLAGVILLALNAMKMTPASQSASVTTRLPTCKTLAIPVPPDCGRCAGTGATRRSLPGSNTAA